MNKNFFFLFMTGVCLLVISVQTVFAQQQAVSRQFNHNSFSVDLPTGRIEDDSALRVSLRDSWFNETPAGVRAKRPEYHTLRGGSRIQVRYESTADEFAVVLARELQGPASAQNPFPGWAQGSWILTRRISDGAAVRIRVFLRSDPYTYIQFRPFNSDPRNSSADKCEMDVVLYNAYLIRSLPLPVQFERLLVLPLEEILALCGSRFPEKYFNPVPGLYRDNQAFVNAVRSKLPELNFADDGAIDQNGDYVFINSLQSQNINSYGLNCSGFAKWIVDGILKPHTGELLPIAPLKEAFGNRGSSYTEPWERIRDPYFGLDWIRNLASRAAGVLRSSVFSVLGEIEVRNQPFSQVIMRDRNGSAIRPYPGFLPDGGFGVEGLHALLYTLAVDEPGRIYLAAVNNETGEKVTPQNPRGLPKLRQFFHIAVFVPYFDEYGNFQTAVFESAAETSISAFVSRYPGFYVNLVRIPIDGLFDPDL